MQVTLQETLPKKFWSHNSGGEHFAKHLGDIPEINHLRIVTGREPFNSAHIEDWMFNDGVIAIRNFTRSTAGTIAGYVVAEKNKRAGTIDVHDLAITQLDNDLSPTIVGCLLGKLITNVYYHCPPNGSTKSDYGKSITINGTSYVLPGVHLQISDTLSGKQNVEKFLSLTPPNDWNGIQTIVYDSAETNKVFVNGEVAGEFACMRGGLFSVKGSDQTYEHPVFAAMSILNATPIEVEPVIFKR